MVLRPSLQNGGLFIMEMSDYKSFETDRFILKPTNLEDAQFIFELMNSEGWLKFIGDRKVRNAIDAAAYIKHKMLPQLLRLGYGNYTIIGKVSQKAMGTVGLYDRDGLEGVDIGFALLPEFQGQGIAFEASNKIMSVAIDIFKIEKILAITTHENTRSQKLIERLGLIYVRDIKLSNDPELLMLYSNDPKQSES